MKTSTNVLADVLAEMNRQRELKKSGKFLWTCQDPAQPNHKKLAVLSEEVGEVAKEVMEEIIRNDKAIAFGVDALATAQALNEPLSDNMYKELIQVAAVAMTWAESL